MKRYLTAFALWLLATGFAFAQVIPGPPAYVIQQLNYKNITAAAPTTTTLKSAAGVLHNLCINNPGNTGTITIYDNTAASGTKIGTITMSSTTQGCFAYDVAFATGLTIVTATAAGDLTVTWY